MESRHCCSLSCAGSWAQSIRTDFRTASSDSEELASSIHEQLAFGLGACALAYELILLRINILVHEPQPATFSMVLTGYLLFWSVGAAFGSRRIPMPLVLGFGLTAGLPASDCGRRSRFPNGN